MGPNKGCLFKIKMGVNSITSNCIRLKVIDWLESIYFSDVSDVSYAFNWLDMNILFLTSRDVVVFLSWFFSRLLHSCEGEGQPTKYRRDLSLPKPDAVWAPSHPKIHQNTTKNGKTSPGVQTRERDCEEGSGEGREIRKRLL